MATHEVDQKLLGRLAKGTAVSHPQVSGALFQLLGLSVMLWPRLVEARKSRRSSMDGDTQSLILLHQILWLSRTGHEIIKNYIDPAFLRRKKPEPLVEIFAVKLKASFEHIFCLFRNDPRIARIVQSTSRPKSQSARDAAVPLAATSGNGRKAFERSHRGQDSSANKENRSPNLPLESSKQHNNLREPIPSMLSETSYITNPYSNISPPPGLPPLAPLPTTPHFIVSTKDYRRTATKSFRHAAKLAEEYLYASHPLLLSIALEHCAFLWDCMHEHESSRRLARSTIRELRRDDTPMDDEEFADASLLVGTLGRMMRRKSSESTPRFGFATPPQAQSASAFRQASQDAPPLPSESQRGAGGSRPIPPTGTKPSSSSKRRSPPDKPLPRLPGESSPTGTSLARNTEISRSIQKTPEEFKIPRRPVTGTGSGSSREQDRVGASSSGRREKSSSSSDKRPSPERTSTKRPGSPGDSPSRRARTRKNDDSPQKASRR